MGIALGLGNILDTAPSRPAADRYRIPAPSERQGSSLLLVCRYPGPIRTGLPITVGTWRNHLWLPSWR
ncbi:hypothetical protein AB0L63_14850 [Nocardia sp. NPDC051990]|uniref:hypothetical protein n=1 Tax=Nocardia sp. NPDC051990 TaxID=3155285 RepID=UPI00341E3C5C